MMPGTSEPAELNAAPPTVLCVDPDPDTLTAAELLLSDAGYEPMLAESGKAALRIVSITRPDLILV